MKANDLSQMRLGFDSHRGPSAPGRGFSLLCGGALMVLLGLMGGCVTEHSGETQMYSDPDVALVYQSTGEFEMAENQFRAAIKAEPTLPRARNTCGAFLYSEGRFIEAEREFYRVTEDTLCSGRPMAFVNLGLCRLQLEDSPGAKASLTRALSIDRRNPVALLEMGFLRVEAGDTNEAARYHGTYRTVSPQQSPRGLLLGLEIADQTGDRDALSSYELALRNLYPDSAEYRVWMERQSR